MIKYSTPGALKLISETPKGAERAKLLQDENLRNAVLTSGANVTIYSGNILPNETDIAKKLGNIYVGLIQRKNKQGKFDGIGALGGLAERTPQEIFNIIPEQEKQKLASTKDDIIIKDGVPTLTFDINIIRINNVMREMREELADLGIKDITIDSSKLELIPMPSVKDDNFIINTWDGTGACFAVNPFCHIYQDNTGLIDKIIKQTHEIKGGEASVYKKIPLLDALCAYGNIATSDHRLEDGRDAIRDYRYPHEYLAIWALASKLLNSEQEFIKLSIFIQQKSTHAVSFTKLASVTSQTINDIAKTLDISPKTLTLADTEMAKIYTERLKKLQKKSPRPLNKITAANATV